MTLSEVSQRYPMCAGRKYFRDRGKDSVGQVQHWAGLGPDEGSPPLAWQQRHLGSSQQNAWIHVRGNGTGCQQESSP